MGLHDRIQLHNLDQRPYTTKHLMVAAFGGPLLGGLMVLGLWLGGVRPDGDRACEASRIETVGWLQHET